MRVCQSIMSCCLLFPLSDQYQTLSIGCMPCSLVMRLYETLKTPSGGQITRDPRLSQQIQGGIYLLYTVCVMVLGLGL